MLRHDTRGVLFMRTLRLRTTIIVTAVPTLCTTIWATMGSAASVAPTITTRLVMPRVGLCVWLAIMTWPALFLRPVLRWLLPWRGRCLIAPLIARLAVVWTAAWSAAAVPATMRSL